MSRKKNLPFKIIGIVSPASYYNGMQLCTSVRTMDSETLNYVVSLGLLNEQKTVYSVSYKTGHMRRYNIIFTAGVKYQ